MSIVFIIRRGDVVYANDIPIIAIEFLNRECVTTKSFDVVNVKYPNKSKDLREGDKVLVPSMGVDLKITRMTSGKDRGFSARLSCMSLNNNVVFKIEKRSNRKTLKR